MIRQCVLLVVLVACGTVGSSESETGTPPDGVTDVLLGQPDPDFGDGGVRLVAPSDEWNRGQDIARMRDDRLVVVGDGGRDGVSYGLVAAFTPDGVLDTAFGDDGVVWAGNPYTNLWLGGVTIDAQGRILAVGTLRFLTEYSGVVVRLHPDGSSDGAFGDGGVLPQCCDRVGEGLGFVDVATQSDGTILAAGNRAGSSW